MDPKKEEPMRRKSRLILAGGFVAFGLWWIEGGASASTANGQYAQSLSGAECQFSQSWGTNTTVSDDYGIGNYSSSDAVQVVCPLPNLWLWTDNGASDFSSVYVGYNDDSSVNPFWCYAAGTTQYYYGGFSTSWYPVRYTCSVYGGCPDLTSQYTGTGTLTLPISGYASSYTVRCGLPPVQSWQSEVLNLYLANY
jgi:hypothetical protein